MGIRTTRGISNFFPPMLLPPLSTSRKKPNSRPIPLGRKCPRGFSLVEVTLALAVMTFVSFSLLGLMPEGLRNHRKSMDLTVQAQITQDLAAMVQRTSFADVKTLANTYFYDAEGLPLEEVDKARAVYEAQVTAEAVDSLITPVWHGTANVQDQLRAVNIEIRRAVSGGGALVSRFTTYVANAGI